MHQLQVSGLYFNIGPQLSNFVLLVYFRISSVRSRRWDFGRDSMSAGIFSWWSTNVWPACLFCLQGDTYTFPSQFNFQHHLQLCCCWLLCYPLTDHMHTYFVSYRRARGLRPVRKVRRSGGQRNQSKAAGSDELRLSMAGSFSPPEFSLLCSLSLLGLIFSLCSEAVDCQDKNRAIKLNLRSSSSPLNLYRRKIGGRVFYYWWNSISLELDQVV